MSNNSLLLVDPDYKVNSSANCHLLLKITNDSFSYAVIEKNSDRIKIIFDKQCCENIEQELKRAFEKDQNLSQNYQTIKAAVHTSNFLFIPDEWFAEKNLSVYAKYLGAENKIYNKPHTKFGFNTLFTLEANIEDKLPEQTVLFPQSEPLLALFDQVANDSILIDFTAKSFNILYILDKKVNFQNHYQAETAEEFNYFLLLIIDQLNLNDSIPVYLQGIINEDDEYYNCLLKYFNNLHFFLPTGKHHSELLADMPKHYFSGLLALDLCE
ncbi:DUF3822 family protein [Pedobacter mucosus]|uniref:DUF3822 family protein n=1 Tax=Pedobacter mucosus TaxID=2895286 RepID=UPI001EE4422A|nr:DUF3822 family protein [Pedobacter mucosus]UKT66064.1 DUF3822 family protein [Pedobacter mucosus]